MKNLRTVSTTFLALAIALCGKSSALAADKALLTIHAFAIDMNGGRAGSLDIVIERWSTEAERQLLRDALLEKGSDKLLSTLQDLKPRAGFIQSGNSLGWDIQYAREEVSEATGSRRIVFATDRPMSSRELATRPRSADYEFTLGELRVQKDGKGEGKLVPAAKVKWNKDTMTIEIENYANEPVRLTNITVEDKQ
jgi:hypothetical protein